MTLKIYLNLIKNLFAIFEEDDHICGTYNTGEGRKN